MQGTTSSPDYKQLNEEQLAFNKAYAQRYEEKELESEVMREEVSKLKWELAWLRRQMYGTKRESFTLADDISAENIQLSLDLSVETIAACKITAGAKVNYVRTKVELIPHPPKQHPGRSKLPDHLRRERILLKPEMDVTGLRIMGDEVTEILDYTPGELYVKQYIRHKYAAPLGAGLGTVITASLPGRIMEKCMAGEGLLAQMVVDKYCDHLPIHRQLQRFARMGVNIAQSTSNDWMRMTLNHLYGLYEVHKKKTLDTGYLSADETPIRVMDEDKKGTTHRGYYWVYYNSVARLVLFDYRPGRGREGPEDMLQGFQGYLQTDGYGAYEDFGKRKGITLMHCMAHARRKFHDALGNDKQRAEHALAMFQQLYAIERNINMEDITGEAVVELRKEKALPILKEMKIWMEQEYPKIVVKKSPIAEAMAYCLPRWERLSLYVQDSQLHIDNNPIENAIRPVAVGRKNYLFAGSHDAAQRAAMVYSLLATCKLHGINPYEWLKDVLEHLHLHNTANMDQLLPQFWQKLPHWDMA